MFRQTVDSPQAVVEAVLRTDGSIAGGGVLKGPVLLLRKEMNQLSKHTLAEE